MTKPNDGGPAFPAIVPPDMGGITINVAPGQSLRDYFAAKAMHALVQHDAMHGDEFGWSPPDGVAPQAYRYADAMIRAREVTS